MFHNPIAVQLYTLRDQCAADFPGTLRSVANLGYGAVELAGFHGVPIAALRSYLTDFNLQVAGSHVGLDDLETNFDRVAEDHKLLGCSWLVVPWLAPELRRTASDWDRVAQRLETMGRRCRENGFALAYHHHDFELQPIEGDPEAGTGFDRLFDRQPEPAYGAELDVYWARFAGGDPADLIRRMSGRCPLLHLKDMARSEKRQFAEVGEGQLDWDGILRAAQEAGVEWLIVEQDTCSRPPLDCVKTSLANLLQMVKVG